MSISNSIVAWMSFDGDAGMGDDPLNEGRFIKPDGFADHQSFRRSVRICALQRDVEFAHRQQVHFRPPLQQRKIKVRKGRRHLIVIYGVGHSTNRRKLVCGRCVPIDRVEHGLEKVAIVVAQDEIAPPPTNDVEISPRVCELLVVVVVWGIDVWVEVVLPVDALVGRRRSDCVEGVVFSPRGECPNTPGHTAANRLHTTTKN